MKIINLKRFRDGGSFQIETDKGFFYFNQSIGSRSHYQYFFRGEMPLRLETNETNMLQDNDPIVNEILEALLNYDKSYYDFLLLKCIKLDNSIDKIRLGIIINVREKNEPYFIQNKEYKELEEWLYVPSNLNSEDTAKYIKDILDKKYCAGMWRSCYDFYIYR